jgi:NDP-sugar pyrophosphorylase family protein
MLPALVLTAGLGTRLDPLTRLLAKPAVPVAGRSLVERVLDWLRLQGVTDLVLNLHHKPETITGIVGDGAHLGMRVRYSWEHPILGSAGGPRRALPLHEADPCQIRNGATLCEVDLAPLVAAHARTGALATLVVVRNTAPDRYNGIVLGEDGAVRDFVPKGRAADSWHFVGVQVVNAAAFASLADGVPAETIAGLYRELVTTQPGSLRAWPVDQPFVDVGTPRDYLGTALARGSAGATGSVIEAAASDVDSTARLARSVVWAGARVGPGVELDECVVADVSLPADFRATRSVLVPASVVRPGDRVTTTRDVAVFPL